jgi:FMN-dependent oxidoreductase (nitrilotriacetate monooxygenase family)
MVINAFTQVSPSQHHPGLWRTPYSQAHPYDDIHTWISMAKMLEEAVFDGIFFADHFGIMSKSGGSYRTIVEAGVVFPNDDPFTICAALATHTSNLMLGFTCSVIQNTPFSFARQISTLDRISDGRVAWNMVTSALHNSYANVDLELPTSDQRYERAREYLSVLYALWEGSWDDDAVLNDVGRGAYADPEKIFKIFHKSENYGVEGPHMCAPTPQRTPFLYMPAMSQTALGVAANHAEGLFIHARNHEHAHSVVAGAKERVADFGRAPEDQIYVQGLKFVVGSTHEEAVRKHAEIDAAIDPRASLGTMSGILGLDLTAFDALEPRPVDWYIKNAPGFNGVFGITNLRPGETEISIKELHSRISPKAIVGTPEEIADEIGLWYAAGVNGINVSDYEFHEGFTAFAQHVMPVLRARGLAKQDYAKGSGRNKIFGRGDRLADGHPGASYRGRYNISLAE